MTLHSSPKKSPSCSSASATTMTLPSPASNLLKFHPAASLVHYHNACRVIPWCVLCRSYPTQETPSHTEEHLRSAQQVPRNIVTVQHLFSCGADATPKVPTKFTFMSPPARTCHPRKCRSQGSIGTSRCASNTPAVNAKMPSVTIAFSLMILFKS